jgi:hypothetical protein
VIGKLPHNCDGNEDYRVKDDDKRKRSCMLEIGQEIIVGKKQCDKAGNALNEPERRPLPPFQRGKTVADVTSVDNSKSKYWSESVFCAR